MLNILKIARREVNRFRSRFSGRSRALVLLAFAVTAALMFFVFNQGFALNESIYSLGVSPDGPAINDIRFHVFTVSETQGRNMVDSGALDVYMTKDRVYYRNDDRSLYAVDALRQYIEKSELRRIAGQYDLDRAFPVRVQLQVLNVTQEGLSGSFVPVATPSATASPDASATSLPLSTAAPTALPVATAAPAASTQAAINNTVNNANAGPPIGFIRSSDVVIPSLMAPPLPISELMTAFIYIVPVFFIGIFFMSSFMEEKLNKKVSILLSTPVRPLEIIAGKLLPYLLISMAIVVAAALTTGADVVLMLGIFLPVILFIFSIYLAIALFYRTFKDQSFFSMATIALVTAYLVFPALFEGINDLSLLSPLTLAIKVYKGEAFGLDQYLLSTGPMYLTFLVIFIISVRVFNEEYLQSYGPLRDRVADAIYHAIDKGHVYLSAMAAAVLSVPVIYMLQLVIISLAFNLPPPYNLHAILLCGVLLEEAGKSAGIVVMLERRMMRSVPAIVLASFLAALGFLAAEKLLLLISSGMVAGVLFSGILSNSWLLVLPLLAHFFCTLFLCLMVRLFGARAYLPALLIATAFHYLYNVYMLGMLA